MNRISVEDARRGQFLSCYRVWDTLKEASLNELE